MNWFLVFSCNKKFDHNLTEPFGNFGCNLFGWISALAMRTCRRACLTCKIKVQMCYHLIAVKKVNLYQGGPKPGGQKLLLCLDSKHIINDPSWGNTEIQGHRLMLGAKVSGHCQEELAQTVKCVYKKQTCFNCSKYFGEPGPALAPRLRTLW